MEESLVSEHFHVPPSLRVRAAYKVESVWLMKADPLLSATGQLYALRQGTQTLFEPVSSSVLT